MMLLFYIGIGVLIYYVYTNNKATVAEIKTAEELLKERFVNGDIDEKTFLQMKETIKG